ncbi:hypothetical protein THRCLA_20831 [Thraustotheca clavata]|uniref:Nbr1 FW domain-containing protein n=1 Tax=Thraustotheca clavata TaxID=74557 RepID=A0A1W0A2Y7_9STRA|nr:hypothetical protein THRCLA_20831 [Thraustotheca clavata]
MSDCDELLRLFQSITTTDHDALINQFSRLLQLDAATSTFFLESSNWNVETAVNMYLATAPTDAPKPEARFLSDLSAAQNAQFLPYQHIQLHLAFQNTGCIRWPINTKLAFYQGNNFSVENEMPIPCIDIGEHTQITLNVTLPGECGTHYGTWRLVSDGECFGDPVWIVLTVVDERAKESMIVDTHVMEVDEDMATYHDNMQPDMEI